MNEAIKNFIIQEIEKISEKFPQISFKYGFDKIGKQHLIEIEPVTEFNNEEYMDLELNTIDLFIYKFPEDEILFISNNKYINIEKVVYKKEGAIQVADELIAISNIHSNNSIIPAPFFLNDYFPSSSQNQFFVCDPMPVNKNNIIEPEYNKNLNYSESFSIAA